jgi:hypothetical protein
MRNGGRGLGSVAPYLNPLRDECLVGARPDAQVCHLPVVAGVGPGLAEPERFPGALREQVRPAACKLGEVRERGGFFARGQGPPPRAWCATFPAIRAERMRSGSAGVRAPIGSLEHAFAETA